MCFVNLWFRSFVQYSYRCIVYTNALISGNMKKNKKNVHLKLNRPKGHRKYRGDYSLYVSETCMGLVNLKPTASDHIKRSRSCDPDQDHFYCAKKESSKCNSF